MAHLGNSMAHLGNSMAHLGNSMAHLLRDKRFCFCLAVDGRLPDRQPRQRRPLLPDDGVHRPAQRGRH